ncbi:MAG: histidinol-phosphatase, partial [Planctomycetes bacterium]|nr:histidinol-phosphatase [Planctomycetota bacterium]
MNNKSVAGFLSRVAMFLELKGESPFKVRSYRNASMTIQDLEEEVTSLIEEGTLTRIKGIGKGLSESISEFIERGSSTLLEALESEVPEGLVEMTGLRGLGPAKVKAIYDKLHISSLRELEYACLENRLKDLKGFGEKSQASILKEILLAKQYAGHFLLHEASWACEEVARVLREDLGLEKTAVAGPVRRSMEVISRGFLVAVTDEPGVIGKKLLEYETPFTVKELRPEGVEIVHASGLPIEIDLVPSERFAGRVHWRTGSKAHLDLLVQAAEKKGLLLESPGILTGGNGRSLEQRSEKELYEILGLDEVPAELREGGSEVEAAAQGRLPELVEPSHLRGILHVHTTCSDGIQTLAQVAQAAQSAGFEYLGVSDHSRSAAYAGGLS